MHVNDFKKMILGASRFFDREKEKINALNVFPVPDGDTGTNMSMTLNAAVEGTMAYEGDSVGELSEAMASRALMGARGNSGVILSQILRGIARGLQKKEHITPAELSKAFQYGVVYAYKAVSTPVEGTILTVAREMARGIRRSVCRGENLYDSMEEAIKSGKVALDKTTDMLPALKEAGVVDAGGLGLLVFLEGCLSSMKQSLNDILSHKISRPPDPAAEYATATTVPAPPEETSASEEPLNLLYPYCTEMIIKNETGDFEGLREMLSTSGDSLIVASYNQSAKVHIHTASPHKVIETALSYGSLHDIKIENMQDQYEPSTHSETGSETPAILPNTEKTETGITGIISVSFGEGFREIFLSLGADEIVFGGQTMNPKVEDLLNAVNKLPQESVIIMPNNKNIIMVAEQVKTLSDKQVAVLETRTLPEGLAALLSFNSSEKLETNLEDMQTAYNRVKTGLIAHATRDAVVKGSKVGSGEYLGLIGDDITAAGTDLHQAALDLADEIIDEDSDIITIFYGRDLSRERAALLASTVEEKYPAVEVELQYGGQPLYYYIFSVE